MIAMLRRGLLAAALALSWAGAALAQDASILLTTGNTSQVLVAAKASGQAVFIHNPSVETETVWVNLGAVAAADVANTSGKSIGVPPGASLSVQTSQSVNAVASDTGHVIVVKKINTVIDAMLAGSGSSSGSGGDASAANQNSQITQETAINTVLGLKGDAKSTATDTTAITIMQVLKEISAMVQAPPAQAATQSGTWTVQPGNTANTTAWKVDGSAVTQPVSAASLPLPALAATSTAQTTAQTSLSSIDTTMTAINGKIPAKTAGGAVPVANVNAAGNEIVSPANSTPTSVPDAATSTLCLASNTAREGARFFNNSTVAAYLLEDEGTASSTNFTVILQPQDFYVLPMNVSGVYTDDVKCIWASDQSGAMLVTEIIP